MSPQCRERLHPGGLAGVVVLLTVTTKEPSFCLARNTLCLSALLSSVAACLVSVTLNLEIVWRLPFVLALAPFLAMLKIFTFFPRTLTVSCAPPLAPRENTSVPSFCARLPCFTRRPPLRFKVPVAAVKFQRPDLVGRVKVLFL